MDVRQLEAALNSAFADGPARIVFWNDPDREFAETLPDLTLPNVKVVDLATVGALELKIRLEREDPEGRYVLYSGTEEPDYEKDWLLDIRLYSRSFRADRASILLEEMGLVRQQMRAHIANRRKFFDNKERVRRLKALVAANDDEIALDRKMLAVVIKADQAELFTILRTLFEALALAGAGEVDLAAVPDAWEQVEKFELDGSFWELVRSTFGYQEVSPNLRNLLIRLLVSDYLHQLRKDPPPALLNLQLPRAGTQNAVVCLAQWRDSSSKAASYNALAAAVAASLQMDGYLQGLEAEDILEVMTFPEIEKAVVRSLLARVSSPAEGPGVGGGVQNVRRIASHRQAGHWVASASVPDAQRNARKSVYEALAVAAEFFDLFSRYRQGFDFPDAAAMYHGYESELFRLDQLHRHFCWHADVAAAQGWDMLKALREDVEASYRNGYLAQLALAWGKFVGSGLLEKWRLPEVPNQYEFYSRQVGSRLAEADRRRVFVIISDALRYEIADELTTRLNGTYRLDATLSSQLGVLPSYTALGMASLLPHERLEYTAKGDVLLDGQGTASFEQRHVILGRVGGMALRAKELMALKKEEGRERIGDRRVVYIYHDEIDARGDKAATEAGTFDAVDKALRELSDLVAYIVNSLNGNHVLVTADHGFLFTETAPNEADKSPLTVDPIGMVIAKKRYLLGRDLPNHPDVWRGRTAETAQAEGGMEFWIPKGANRFHFTGGARFVHGGAMLQEIVVPIVTIRLLKAKSEVEKSKTRQVAVQVLYGPHKITTPKHRFTLMQMEAVSDRIKPVTLKVAVYEGNDPISSIETVTFESATENMKDREKSVMLTLQDRAFDKKTPYRLLLRDSETGIQTGSVEVTIDRAISDDFNF